MFHLRDEAGRPEQVHRGRAADAHAQQPVEADEMVHVGVGDERMRDAQELSCRQSREIAQVEQEGAALEQEVDVESGVAEGAVDEGRLEDRTHRDLFAGLTGDPDPFVAR